MYTATSVDPNKPVPKPAFTLRELEGSIERPMRFYDKQDKVFKTTVVEEPAGYMLTTMRGDEIRIASLDDLKQYGLGDHIKLVNADDGEVMGAMPVTVQKKEDK